MADPLSMDRADAPGHAAGGPDPTAHAGGTGHTARRLLLRLLPGGHGTRPGCAVFRRGHLAGRRAHPLLRAGRPGQAARPSRPALREILDPARHDLRPRRAALRCGEHRPAAHRRRAWLPGRAPRLRDVAAAHEPPRRHALSRHRSPAQWFWRATVLGGGGRPLSPFPGGVWPRLGRAGSGCRDTACLAAAAQSAAGSGHRAGRPACSARVARRKRAARRSRGGGCPAACVTRRQSHRRAFGRPRAARTTAGLNRELRRQRLLRD